MVFIKFMETSSLGSDVLSYIGNVDMGYTIYIKGNK